MPQQNKLEQAMLSRPAPFTGEVKYPDKGVSNSGDDFLRGLMVALGVEEQKPGDTAGAVGGAAGLATALINPRVAKMLGGVMLNKLKTQGIATPIPKLKGEVLGLQDRALNKPLPDKLVEALELAQKRWPRLFGQLDNVEYLAPHLAAQPGVMGAAVPSREFYRPSPTGGELVGRTSKLQLEPSRIKPGEEANTVGHELLHVKDFLVKPEIGEIQRIQNELPGGYLARANEIRARLQGARTQAYAHGFGRKDIEPHTAVSFDVDRDLYSPLEGFDIVKAIDSRISGLPPKPVKK